MKIGYYPRKSHRKLVAIIVAAAVLILLAAGLIIVATRPVFVSGSVDTSYMNRTQPVSFNWPTPGRGAIGTLDGGLEATSGDNKAYPTASLAKLITALVVLQKYPLDGGDGQTLTIGQTDVNFYNQTIADGGSNLPVKLGETLSEKTALSGMLVASADNLADSLASWAFGSLENYRATATTWLKQNGLTGTTIGRDASGLDPGTVSTTTDLFKLGQLTLKNADLKNIVSQTTLAWQGKIVKNTNQLLGQDGYIGVKTGYTRQAGGCLIFAKNVSLGGKTITLLGVITGATDENQRFTDAQNLLDNWPLNLLNSIVARPGNVLGQVSTGWNSGSEITASGNLSTTRWGDQTAGAKAQLSQIKIPAKSDQVVGQLTVGGKSTNLVLQSDIAAPGLWWRLTHLSQLSW